MDILSYKDLQDKEQIFRIHHEGLGMIVDPNDFDLRMQWDPLLKDGPGGFCAVIDGRLVGFVGVLEFPTRTLSGEIMIGGIWGVVTDPLYTKRGIFSKLMERSHEYFQAKGIEVSFLYTYRSWISYEFYKKLGYLEIPVTPKVKDSFKLVTINSESTNVIERTTLNGKSMQTIFSNFVKNKTGFVLRDENFFDWMIKRGQTNESTSWHIGDGYVMFDEKGRYRTTDKGILEIQEIISSTTSGIQEIINYLYHSDIGVRGIIDPVIADNRVLDVYQRNEYQISNGNYKVLLYKPLSKKFEWDSFYGEEFYYSLPTFF